MMTRTAGNHFSQWPEDSERFNGQAGPEHFGKDGVYHPRYQQQAYGHDNQTDYQQHRDYNYQQNQGNRYADNRDEQFRQHSAQYRNNAPNDHRQNSYHDNKENKNNPYHPDYYKASKEDIRHGQGWSSDEQRRSRHTPPDNRSHNRRSGERRRSEEYHRRGSQKYSSRQKDYSASKSYRSRSPRRRPSRLPSESRKRSRKKERSRSRSSISSGSTSVTPDGSARRRRSPNDRKENHADLTPERRHESEHRSQKLMSVVTEVKKRKVNKNLNFDSQNFNDRSRYTWKRPEAKEEMKMGDLAMSPISGDDFSQRNEEAESEADKEELVESKPASNAERQDIDRSDNDTASKETKEKEAPALITQNEKIAGTTESGDQKDESEKEEKAPRVEMKMNCNEMENAYENVPKNEAQQRNTRKTSIEELKSAKNKENDLKVNIKENSDHNSITEKLNAGGCFDDAMNSVRKKEKSDIDSFIKDTKTSDKCEMSKEKQSTFIDLNKVGATETLPDIPVFENDNKVNDTRVEDNEVEKTEEKKKGSLEELKKTLTLTKTFDDGLVNKIVSFMASKTKHSNGSDIHNHKTQDKDKKEVQTSANTTESNKDKKLKCSKNVKHSSKEENGHENTTCERSKMVKENVTVEREKEKWEKSEAPSFITTQGQQNKVCNKFGSSSSDKKDTSRHSPIDLDESRSNVSSPKEKKTISVKINSKEDKGCQEILHLDSEHLQRKMIPKESPDHVQISASAIEKRHTGVKETDKANARKRHRSESSSPAVIKGTMNRPSNNVFIPLGNPAEKKQKLTPTNSAPDPADLAGTKPGDVTKLVKEKETKPFSEVKNDSGEVRFNTAPDNVTEEKETTTPGSTKYLFGKNKIRISHFNTVNKTEDPKSQAQAEKTKIMNHSQLKTSASKPQKHPFKKFPIKRTATEESKQVKAKQQIQRSVIEKESKHTDSESREDIEKTKGKGDNKMKLSKTNNHRSKHESKKDEKLGKRQNLISGAPESKKPKIDEIKRNGPNKDKDHFEVTTNYFKKLNERIESKSLSARKTQENQDLNVKKCDINAQADKRTIADTKMTNFIGIESTGSVTAPLKCVVEDKKQDLAEKENDQHLLKEKTDADMKKTKLVDINYSTAKKAAVEATDKQDNNVIKVQNSLNDKKRDKEIPSQNAMKDIKTVKKISRQNAPKNEKTDKDMDLQNAADIGNCGKEMDTQNVFKDEKTEKEIVTGATETDKKSKKETETKEAPKGDKTNEKLKPQAISNNDISSKESGILNISKYDEIASSELKEKFEKSENYSVIKENEFDQNTHSDRNTDCESDIDMDDIEPIEMIGSVFMNDVNMDEPAESIRNNRIDNHIDFESNETDFKVDYCDDSVVFHKKNPEDVSESVDEVDKAVENDTEDEAVSRKKTAEHDSYRHDVNTSRQTEKECDELIDKSFESYKIKDSTFKSPDKPTKTTPRKRFAPKLETLGFKLIEEEKELEKEEFKDVGVAKTKSSMQYVKKKSNTESECSDDDDTELLASRVDVSNGVGVTGSVTTGTSVTTSTEWLKKAKSNLKLPTSLTKPKTQIQTDQRDTNIDIIPNMPQSGEPLSKQVFDKGFALTHKKWLLDGGFEQTYAHLFPNKLYKTTSQGKRKNLGKCLQCQSCSMFFTPLNFTVHHDTNIIVEQIDVNRSKLERYCLHEKGNNDTNRIFKDFLTYFINERSKRYDASPVKLPRTTTPTVEESDKHEEDLPSAQAILQQDTFHPISEDTLSAKSRMSLAIQRETVTSTPLCIPKSNRSVTHTLFKPENPTVQTSAKPEKITVRTSSKPGNATVHTSFEPTKTAVQTSAKPENTTLLTASKPEAATVQTFTRPENTSVEINYDTSKCETSTVSTAKMPLRENYEIHGVQPSMTNIIIPSTELNSNQNGIVTAAQQFRSLNRGQMSHAQVAQQNSIQQIQMTLTPNNQHHQQNQYFQPVNQNHTCTSVAQHNSMHQLQTQQIPTPTTQKRQSFTNQGMHLATQQFQPKVTKSTGKNAIQQGRTGMTNDMQQTRAYQQSVNHSYQENQPHGSGQGNYSANNPPVSSMNGTSFAGKDQFSSQNALNVPMFNSLTAPLMDQNIPAARNQGQAHTGYQPKPPGNRNDYTGIPFAVSRSQGIPVVLPNITQTSQQSANAENVTQNVNYTMALAQIEMPGVQEPVRPNVSTQSMEATTRQHTSSSRAFVSISDKARQLMKAAAVEEKRRKLYKELCDLDDINSGDVGLDIMLLAEKSYLRGLTLIDKDILRLTEENCETILRQQQQQLPTSQHGKARQSMEERVNYLGQLKRYPQ